MLIKINDLIDLMRFENTHHGKIATFATLANTILHQEVGLYLPLNTGMRF